MHRALLASRPLSQPPQRVATVPLRPLATLATKLHFLFLEWVPIWDLKFSAKRLFVKGLPCWNEDWDVGGAGNRIPFKHSSLFNSESLHPTRGDDNEFWKIFLFGTCSLLPSYSLAVSHPFLCLLACKGHCFTRPPFHWLWAPRARERAGLRPRPFSSSSWRSCLRKSLWPLPLPALIPDLQSLGSSLEARSQHHGNPTSLSNHRLTWQQQHRQARMGWAEEQTGQGTHALGLAVDSSCWPPAQATCVHHCIFPYRTTQ